MSNEEKDYDSYLKEQHLLMDSFIVAFGRAHREGLAHEWLLSFFDSTRTVSEDAFKEAISFANKEWDL